MTTVPRTALQIRSLVKTNGELELSSAEFEVPKPADGEVLVCVEAAPINPSDQALPFAGADLSTLRATGSASRPAVTAQVPPGALRSMAGRAQRSDTQPSRRFFRPQGRGATRVARVPAPAPQPGR